VPDDETPRQTVIAYEGVGDDPLSIRAKAMVFGDAASQALLRYLERLAPSDMPVLISGETGTGKELVARHLHKLSRRRGPFLALNCGAISEHLAESELFGHEPGAFTGAAGRREGWFEAAHGGTLFLDEIGDLPLPMQTKLLRVIQEREVVRIGSRRSVPVDVRLVVATNLDLQHEADTGRFRRDLLYRLNVAQVHLQPLRERRGDIPALVEHFLSVYRSRLALRSCAVSREALQALMAYPWPGNIRELENVMHFAMLVADEGIVLPEHLKIPGGWSVDAWGGARAGGADGTDPQSPLDCIDEQLQRLFRSPDRAQLHHRLERLVVQRAFEASGRNQVRMAELLGVTRNVVRTFLRRHGLTSAQAPAGPREAAAARDLPLVRLVDFHQGAGAAGD